MKRSITAIGLVVSIGIPLGLQALAQNTQPAQNLPPSPDARVTIVDGEQSTPLAPRAPAAAPPRGDVSLNFPSANINTAAKAILGDLLHIPYSVAPGLSTSISVVSPYPVARSAVLPLFEEALRAGGLAMVRDNGAYRIQTVEQARSSGTAGSASPGFGNEVVELQFVNATQMKALLDPVLPGVATQNDPSRNVLTLSGTAGQRASARDLLRQFDVNWLRNVSFALIVPQRTDSRLIVPELEKLLNAPDAPTRGLVRIISMEKINGILAVSTQRQYLDDVSRWIDILDREGQNNEKRLFVYRVQNGRSRDLVKTLNTAFGSGTSYDPMRPDNSNPDARSNTRNGVDDQASTAAPIPATGPARPAVMGAASGNGGNGPALSATISGDDTNNAVLVFGTPRDYAIIEEALRKLDVLPYQVLIEAAITEVSLNNDLRYGLQWNFASGETTGALTESTTGTGLIRTVPGFSFLFAHNNSISAVLNTLETKTRVNVVSAPKLLVLNNQTAALQVGDQVPIATQNSTATTDPNAPTINSIEYRDTGVILKITPRVNGSGLVLLDISQEVSDVKNGPTRAGINSPTISTRRVSTSVAVQDGEVLALGGLIRNAQSRDRIGIPFLSQIPIIGGAFGRHVNSQDKTELVILIKPQVVRSVDDGRAITEELRSKIQSLEPFKSSGKIP